jgi:hypothetical protein
MKVISKLQNFIRQRSRLTFQALVMFDWIVETVFGHAVPASRLSVVSL